MTAFYARLAAGDQPAAALAAAKRGLRDRGRRGGCRALHGHPYYWAPFVLVDHRLRG